MVYLQFTAKKKVVGKEEVEVLKKEINLLFVSYAKHGIISYFLNLIL